VPVVLAGWLRRVPILIYLPDIEPGLAVRFLARFADRVAVSFEEVARYFAAGQVVVTGYPVRPELLAADPVEVGQVSIPATRRPSPIARARLDLEPGRKTLLVFGGSHGARSINVAVSEIAAELAEEYQVLHIAGREDEHWLQARREELPDHLRRRYRVYAYLHQEMADALAAADLVVARAGAATLGEFPAVGLPSLLVPYPYAGQHQWLNADYLAQAGAAVVVDDADLSRGVLLPTIRRLLDDEATLLEMRANARRLARPEAAWRIADEIWRMGSRRDER
jgi:UDP-N-acetylglucosamine--N-acetylmuramyl-(pentapeptide) pyrophosphoryl-undecaprenol N-acetylglucosamine transferase